MVLIGEWGDKEKDINLRIQLGWKNEGTFLVCFVIEMYHSILEVKFKYTTKDLQCCMRLNVG
jgi:hypothetical protein